MHELVASVSCLHKLMTCIFSQSYVAWKPPSIFLPNFSNTYVLCPPATLPSTFMAGPWITVIHVGTLCQSKRHSYNGNPCRRVPGWLSDTTALHIHTLHYNINQKYLFTTQAALF